MEVEDLIQGLNEEQSRSVYRLDDALGAAKTYLIKRKHGLVDKESRDDLEPWHRLYEEIESATENVNTAIGSQPAFAPALDQFILTAERIDRKGILEIIHCKDGAMQVVNQLTSEFRLFLRQLVRIAERDSPSPTNGFRELRSKLSAPQLAILDALAGIGITSRSDAISQAECLEHAGYPGAKTEFRRLNELGLINSARSVGTWLTPRGVDFMQSVDASTKSTQSPD